MAATGPEGVDSIRLVCSTCNQRYLVKKARPGQRYTCKKCGSELSPPAEAQTAPPRPQSAPLDNQRTVRTSRPAPAGGDDRTRTSGGMRLAADRDEEGQEIPHEIPVRLGRYIIDGEVARGGMGVIYKGRQEGLDRVVAIKMMLPGAISSPEMRRRFEREAKAVGKLQHPNIVAVHEVGDFQGSPFFTMDFIDGVPLDILVKKGPLSPNIAATIMRDVARAIAYAHSKGVIHRDIKPGNILIERDGRPKITDFGLAKDFTSKSMLSVSGDIMGTPAFMAPEQAEGRIGEVDEQSDVYSLGAVLYMLITGCHPFEGKTLVDTLTKVVHEYPIPPATVNPEVETDLGAICTKAMEKEKTSRYAGGAEMAADLDRFLKGEPVTAKPWTAATLLRHKLKKNKRLAAVAVVSLLIVIGVLAASPFIFRKDYLEFVKEQLAQGDEKLQESTLRALGGEILQGRRFPGERAQQAVQIMTTPLAGAKPKVRDAILDFLMTASEKPDLVTLAAPYVSDPLCKLIANGQTDPIRIRAIEVAVKMKLKRAVPVLIETLSTPSDKLRLSAVRALGEIPNGEAVPKLLKLSFDDPVCRSEARAALDKLYKVGSVEPFAPLGAGVSQSLAKLQQAFEDRNREAEEMLASMGAAVKPKVTKSALQLTMEKLKDPDSAVRLKAAYELSIRADPEALPALLDALGDSDATVGAAVADAMVRTGADKCRDKLLDLLCSDNPATRKNAATVLVVSGKATADDLLSAWPKAQDEKKKARLIEALAAIGGRPYAKNILDIMESQPAMKDACRKALTSLAGKDLGDDPKEWKKWLAEKDEEKAKSP